MDKLLHELAHNNEQRRRTPASARDFDSYFNELAGRLLRPADESDDPWRLDTHPLNEDLGTV